MTLDRRIPGIAVMCCLVAVASCAKHYRVDGMVLRKDRDTVTISHRDIQGYMPAMTMPFRVRRGEQGASLTPGTRVRFRLTVSKTSSIADRFEKRAPAPLDFRLPATERLPIGAAVPDFALVDQSGQSVKLSDFRGKVVAIDFIYTRCPLPEVCPRLSANFARLQRRFGAGVQLLSISIDPQYDTPEVLARYARIWNAKPDSWRFLTGNVAEVRAVASKFGMSYWPEEGTMSHTSETAVIARDGTLAGIVEGAAYAVSQLGDLIALQLKEGR